MRLLRRLLPALLAPFARRLEARRAGRSWRILTWHRVADHRPGDRLCVRRAAFAAQLDHLAAAGRPVLPLAEAAARTAWPAGAVCLTFDDGWADNLEAALPELERAGMHATVFLAVDALDRPGPMQGAPGGDERDRALSWAEVETLAASERISIGSHTLTHPDLTGLDDAGLVRELVESRLRLEARLGRPVTHLAYPRGRHDARVVRVAREAGYDLAVTVRPGANGADTPRLELRRTEVSGDDGPEDFARKLEGAFDWIHAIRQGRWIGQGR